MRDEGKTCGTCRWHHWRNEYDGDLVSGWECTNDESRYCGAWTEYDDGCEDWEER